MDYIFVWGYHNFLKEDKSVKNMKITPTRKFPRLQYTPPIMLSEGLKIQMELHSLFT